MEEHSHTPSECKEMLMGVGYNDKEADKFMKDSGLDE